MSLDNSTPETAQYNEVNFLRAIAGVETSGGTNIKRGDNGKAWGKYQMHKVFVEDVNLLLGTNYKHEDTEHPVKGEQIAKDAYRAYYGYLKNRNIEPTDQRMAYIWNGGRSAHEYTDPAWVSQRANQEGVSKKAQNLGSYYTKFLSFSKEQQQQQQPQAPSATVVPSQPLTPEESQEMTQTQDADQIAQFKQFQENFEPFLNMMRDAYSQYNPVSTTPHDGAEEESPSDLK